MKYPQLVSSSTPASLQDWLEEELESRGIDGVYTRYILSLLQQDSIDLDPLECEHIASNGKSFRQISLKDAERSKYRRSKSWARHLKGDLCSCTKPLLFDTEKRKKTAAVECLKSASEQKIGIEKLIDEVCTKLKHVQAKETLHLINSSPEICLQHAELLESSVQEQAEKYYAAFPALSGKHEPLAKLCQQQEIWTVWDGRKVVNISKKDISKVLEDDTTNSDTESNSSEKENRDVLLDMKSNVMQSTGKTLDAKQALQINAKSPPPAFIVPKMKIPVHKVANLSMYSPFTSSAYQVSKTISADCKTEYLAERKLFGRDKWAIGEDQFNVAALPKKLLMETDTWELLASLGASTPFGKSAEDNEYQDNLVTDLASKFDENLASIWAKADAESVEDLRMPDELELSLRIFSVKTPVRSHDSIVNKEHNVTSVWAVSLEDFKNMKLQEQLGSPIQLTSVISIPNLLHSLASHTTTIPGKDILEPESFSRNLELQNASESNVTETVSSPEFGDIKGRESDVESILFTCPDTLFSTSCNDIKSPYSSEYGSISPSDLLVGDAQRIYHLWEEAEQSECSNIWAKPNDVDKVVNWISSQSGSEQKQQIYSDLKVNDRWKIPFPSTSSPSRENCTITHHKGESCFVEVIPSYKSTHLPKIENVGNCSSASLLEIEDGENLLTSPKTHFQPIRQESFEGESVVDETEALGENTATSTPTIEDSFPSSMIPEMLSPPPGFKRSMSSSLEELVGITELSGFFSKDRDSSRETEILDMITRGWKTDILEDKSTSTESPCLPIPNVLAFRNSKVWSSGSVEETLSEVSVPWKWSTSDDTNNFLWLAPLLGQDEEVDDEIFEEAGIGYSADGIKRDYNVKALRKELEEEEEELFRNINCLSDSDTEVSYKEILGSKSPTYNGKLRQNVLFSETKLSSCFKSDDWGATGQALKNGDFISEIENKDFRESDNSNSTFPLVPVDKVLYSSELEDEWRKASEPFDVQVPKRSKSKPKMMFQKRPCTFYLEGNCRRSDCKFSHDLASITCRFWEEGSCFKGITCPFLHGYISDIHPSEDDAPSHKFTLESESDFPSLSKSGMAVNMSVSAPSKNTGRIIRPKKKKQSTNETQKRPENPDPTIV